MRRRSTKAFWPVVLLVFAVGVVARGRFNTSPIEAISQTSSPAAEKTATMAAKAPPQVSPAVVAPESQKVPAGSRQPERKAQLRLRVVGVHDGDSLTGLDDTKTQYKIRLDAIDAPELGQPFGQASKKALSEKVFGKDVLVTVKTRDKYGRTVGHVLVEGRDVNLELLEEGMAWHYEKYDRNKRMQEAERSARNNRRGLWKDQQAIAPWDWRSHNRGGP